MLKRRRAQKAKAAAEAEARRKAEAEAKAKASGSSNPAPETRVGSAGASTSSSSILNFSQSSQLSALEESGKRKKRCPYCGSPHLITYDDNDRIQVVCGDCGANVYIDSQLTIEEDPNAIARFRGQAIQRHQPKKQRKEKAEKKIDIHLPEGITAPESFSFMKKQVSGKILVSALHRVIEQQVKDLTTKCGYPNAVRPRAFSIFKTFFAKLEESESQAGDVTQTVALWSDRVSLSLVLAMTYLAVVLTAEDDPGGGFTCHDIVSLVGSRSLLYLDAHEVLGETFRGVHISLFFFRCSRVKCPSASSLYDLTIELADFLDEKLPPMLYNPLKVGTRVLLRCIVCLNLGPEYHLSAFKNLVVMLCHPNDDLRYLLQSQIKGHLGIYSLVLLSIYSCVRQKKLVMQPDAFGGYRVDESCDFVHPVLVSSTLSPIALGAYDFGDIGAIDLSSLWNQIRNDPTKTTEHSMLRYLREARSPSNVNPYDYNSAPKMSDFEDTLASYTKRCFSCSVDASEWASTFAHCNVQRMISLCSELCDFQNDSDENDLVRAATTRCFVQWFSERYSVGESKKTKRDTRSRNVGAPRSIIATWIHKNILIPLRKMEPVKGLDATSASAGFALEEVSDAVKQLRSAGKYKLRIVIQDPGRAEK